MECAKARSAVTSTASMPRRNPVGEMSFRSAKLTSLWPTPAPDIVHLMCDLCRDSWKPWIHRQYVQLARDFERHAELCKRPERHRNAFCVSVRDVGTSP